MFDLVSPEMLINALINKRVLTCSYGIHDSCCSYG